MDSFARLLDACSKCLCRFENLVGERPVLAAVSGGVDSTVLLHALHRLQTERRLPGPLHVCHVDHAVRPDSRDTARHVAELCERLEVPLTVRRLVPSGERPSEDTLRRARYAELLQTGRDVGAGLLVTAHHADDNLETVLFRMLRGTGPRGLAGIPESRWLGHGEHRMLLRPRDKFWDGATAIRGMLGRGTLLDLPEHGQGFLSAAPQKFAASAREFLDR